MDDFQWPKPDMAIANFGEASASDFEVRKRIEIIENWFENQTGCSSVLFSSGRSAISTILQLHNINRNHRVYAPSWSSFCLWDSICRRSNPTCILDRTVDLGVIVHKWGHITLTKNHFSGLIIEDSVDNIISKHGVKFPNNGQYEILSLPKIMGTYVGGVALAKNEFDAEKLRQLRKDNDFWARKITELKFLQAKHSDSNIDHSWQDIAHKSNGLEINGIINIESALPNLLRNVNTIERRLVDLTQNDKLKFLVPHLEKIRLPPLIPIKSKMLSHLHQDFLIRNFNYTCLADEEIFEPSVLLPLHFGVSDDFFSGMKQLIMAHLL